MVSELLLVAINQLGILPSHVVVIDSLNAVESSFVVVVAVVTVINSSSSCSHCSYCICYYYCIMFCRLNHWSHWSLTRTICMQ